MENITQLLKNAAEATTQIKILSAEKKQQVLEKLAQEIDKNTAFIISENKKDLDKMADEDPKKDRLLLNEDRIKGLAQSIIEVSKLDDPTGKVISETHLDNGLFIQK